MKVEPGFLRISVHVTSGGTFWCVCLDSRLLTKWTDAMKSGLKAIKAGKFPAFIAGHVEIDMVEVNHKSAFSRFSILRHIKTRLPICLLLAIVMEILLFLQFGYGSLFPIHWMIVRVVIKLAITSGAIYITGGFLILMLGAVWLFLTGSPHDRPFKKEPSTIPKTVTAMRIICFTIEGFIFAYIAFRLYLLNVFALYFE